MSFDTKTKELIAIGASVSTHCQPCLRFHVAKGKEAGLTDVEINAAILVGKTVGNGASNEMDKFSSEMMNVSFASNPCGCQSC